MSRKPEKKSGEASDRRDGSYVYDFLYHDARRVASLLSQFGRYGQLTAVEHSKSASESTAHKTRARAGGGVPGVASAGAHHDAEVAKESDTAVRAVYDPLWVNALDLYERLDANGFLNRDGGGGMGQFVVATGALTVLDMSLLKLMMESAQLRKSIIGAATGKTDAPSGPRQAKKQAAEAEAMGIGVELMRIMPHLIQMRLATGNAAYWGSLVPEGMTVPPADLYLKHGHRIGGSWTMLGILDALPDPEMSELEQNVAALTQAVELGAYAQGLGILTPFVRPLLGRPAEAYGITPLLIFREVSGR